MEELIFNLLLKNQMKVGLKLNTGNTLYSPEAEDMNSLNP